MRNIETNLKTINQTIINPDIKPINISNKISKFISYYIRVLYDQPNIPIEVTYDNSLDFPFDELCVLIQDRLNIEHPDKTFDFFHKLKKPYFCLYEATNNLKIVAEIDSYIDRLFDEDYISGDESNENIKIKSNFVDERYLVGLIFQRLRNEHSVIVENFIPTCVEGDYFIKYVI